MNKAIAIILTVLISGVSVLAGAAVGFNYFSEGSCPEKGDVENFCPEKIEIEAFKKLFSSKMVISSTFLGKVSSINGRNVTLDLEGESATFFISEKSKIITHVSPKAGESGISRLEIPFENIKIGDNLTITAKLTPEGALESSLVSVSSK